MPESNSARCRVTGTRSVESRSRTVMSPSESGLHDSLSQGSSKGSSVARGGNSDHDARAGTLGATAIGIPITARRLRPAGLRCMIVFQSRTEQKRQNGGQRHGVTPADSRRAGGRSAGAPGQWGLTPRRSVHGFGALAAIAFATSPLGARAFAELSLLISRY